MTSGGDTQAFYRALLSAFPSEGELKRMLQFGMQLNLAEIASGNLSEQTFAVVRFAESRGLVDQLLNAAVAANPDNAELRAYVDRRAHAQVAPPATVAPAPQVPTKINKVALRKAMQDAYSLEELELLCADLRDILAAHGHDIRLSLDDLAGASKPAKILSLIEFLDRRRVLEFLAERVREQRPGSV
jgi:hypothetical protein